MAASPTGVAVVGRYPLGFYYTPGEAAQHADGLATVAGTHPAAAGGKTRPPFQNLVVVKPDRTKPIIWSRPVSADVAPSPAPEKGIYGPAVPPHEDLKFQAPLSVAIDRAGNQIAVGRLRSLAAGVPPARRRRRHSIRHSLHALAPDDSHLRPARQRDPPHRPGEISRSVLVRPGILPRTAERCSFRRTIGPAAALAASRFCPPTKTLARFIFAISPAATFHAIRFPDADFFRGCDAQRHDRRRLLESQSLFARQIRPARSQACPTGSTSARRASCMVRRMAMSRFAVATTAGIVRMLDGTGKTLWETNLNQQVRPGDKPWTKNQKAERSPPASGAPTAAAPIAI